VLAVSQRRSDKYRESKVTIATLVRIFIFGTVVAAVGAHAQSLSEHEKQLKQGLDQLQQQLAPLQQRPDVRLSRPEAAQSNLSADTPTSQCFDVQLIEVKGNQQLSSEFLHQLTQPFVGQCLGLAQINQLIAVISNAYLEQGFVTSRAYIAPQDLSDGRLELVVIEGVIEAIQSADGRITPQQLAWAFPAQSGDVLNIRALEQGIENLNRLASNHSKVDLKPGSAQGESLVSIFNQPTRAWRGSLGLNNHGVASTGQYQVDGYLAFDNVFAANDNGYLSASTNTGGHDLPQAQSRSYAAAWSLPFGYWHLSLNHNHYSYQQVVVGERLSFATSGSSAQTGIQVSRNLYRSQTGKLDISAAFNRKDSKNYLEDVFLETSSRTLYVWDLALNYRHYLADGTLSLNGGLVKSVAWFGATQQLDAAEDNFQFNKYRLNLSYDRPLQLADQPLLYAVSAEFLYSPHIVVASEGFTVGGRYSVRGLSQSSLFGYKGGYLRNDLSLPFELSSPLLNQGQLLLGVDAGWSNLPEFPDKQRAWVAGSAIGIKLFDRSLSVSLTYARALRTPDFLPQKQQEIDASLRFNF